jgi:hypothetical protein
MSSHVPELTNSISGLYLSACFTIGLAACLTSGYLRREDAHDIGALVSRPGQVHVDENSMQAVVDSQDLPAEAVSRSA